MYKKIVLGFLIALCSVLGIFGGGYALAKTFSVNLGERTQDFWRPISNYLQTNSLSGYHILINGTSRYLNFNTTSGATGYGFRDNAGVMEVKNSGGSWGGFISSMSPNITETLTVGNGSVSSTINGSTTSIFGAGVQATALNITSTSATSTFANGIDISKGCFAINGTCIGGAASGANAALSNLSGVAINTSLLPGSAIIDLGSYGFPFRDTYTSGTFYGTTWNIASSGVVTGLTGNVSIWTNDSGYAVVANGIGQFANNTGYVTATSSETLSNKAGQIGMWTNGTGYITATSSETLTNKSGQIGLWVNGTGYITATSSETLTNKAGQISQWTNNTAYLTATSTIYYPAFRYATSTWSGTSTIALGPAFTAETWSSIKCFTNAGTVDVYLTDGTNRMNWLQASSTVGTVTLSINNTFTASEKRYVELGNPLTSPTEVSCTVSKIAQ